MKLIQSLSIVASIILGLSSAARADVITDQSMLSPFAQGIPGLTTVGSR